MVLLFSPLMLLGLFGPGLALVVPAVDKAAILSTESAPVASASPEVELPKSECDNRCLFASFPAGSCNCPICMCTQSEKRNAYFCCMAKECDSDVLLASVERQHAECRVRNQDFTFDAEKTCGVKLATNATPVASSASADPVYQDHLLNTGSVQGC